MQILPVLDLLNGVVVRGIAGQRDQYHPIKSELVSSSRPLDVARAMRSVFGLEHLYLADLDGILHQTPNWQHLEALISDGFQVAVDIGLDDDENLRRLSRLGVEVIAGLESSSSPDQVSRFTFNCDRLTFSLDLKQGELLMSPNAKGWGNDPLTVVSQVIECGIGRVIVLDLADVGTEQGTRTMSFCKLLKEQFPNLHLTSGGGIRGLRDLKQWEEIGVDRVLVATALHNGKLTPHDIQELHARSAVRSEVS